MRILIAHNHYNQAGGEDAVVKTESALLKKFNQEVYLYERHNKEIDSYSLFKKLNFLLRLDWSKDSYRQIKKIIREFRPDVAHFHNIFFVMTPSVYFACKEEGVPVVQSQHNFRLICSNGLLFRDNQVCEECVQKTLWRGVYHRCYKNSRLATALVVRMLQKHWKQDTWRKMIDLHIALSEFSRQKLVAGGIPPHKIVVKPNFIYPDSKNQRTDRGYALYVGRLSVEKGVYVLLDAWKSIKNLPLKIMGDGPLSGRLQSYVESQGIHQVDFLGYVPEGRYEECMKGAKILIVPSVCYENFPRVIAEAFSYGIPVVASRLGSMEELVKDKETGLLFRAGDPHDLKEKITWMLEHGDELEQMGKKARREYEEKYAAETSYKNLMDIYRKVTLTVN